MLKNIRKAVSIISMLLFCFIDINAGIKDAGSYFKENVVLKELKNGIKVIMLNRGRTPTLALIISFKTGSVEESYKTAGMAHMLEHMLFKGTDKIGTRDYAGEKKILDEIEALGETIDRIKLEDPGNSRLPALRERLKELQKEHRRYIISSPYSKIYSSNGAVGFNAFTSRDRTAYVIELPASKLGLWADIESSRLKNPVMREFYTERDTVYEERLMRYESSGTGLLFEKFIATAYIAHPYRHPVIGWDSNIKYLSLRDMKDFYRSNYVPSKMTITIVGKQDTDETLKIINRYFGTLEERGAPPLPAVREPRQDGERRFILNFDASPYLVMGWHKPTFPSRDDFICDIIAELLSDGKTSRLYRALVLEKKIATAVYSWNGYPGVRYDNLFVVSATPRSPHTLQELEKSIYAEMDRMKGDLNKEEINRIINRMESSLIFGLDSNMGIAEQLSYYQTLFSDWRYIVHYMDELKTITVKDVRDFMDKYLIKSNRTVGMLVKKNKE